MKKLNFPLFDGVATALLTPFSEVYSLCPMHDFVHLHVHTQYSLLDGQASIPRLVDKAIKDGMRGMAVTDHGNMMGMKEFFNYVKKKNSARKEEVGMQQKAHRRPSLQ